MTLNFATPQPILARVQSDTQRCSCPLQKARYDRTARMSLDYASSGVDIDVEGASVRALVQALGASRSPRQAGTPGSSVAHGGGFSGLIEFGSELLAMCTDGVGSKMVLAEQANVYDTVGLDVMAMNVNDLLCVGAEPLAFVDYIAAARPDPDIWAALGRSLAAACRAANVTLAGGETATLPDVVSGIDLSGTALGSVRAGLQLDGARVSAGDRIIALPSSGLHSNGYTLARAIVDRARAALDETPPFELSASDRARLWRAEGDATHTLAGALLTPTAIYVDPLVPLFKAMRAESDPAPYDALHGLAHITGGGLSNLLRLKEGVGFHISNPLPVHTEFNWLQRAGQVSDLEMHRVFNMGMGMCLIVDGAHAKCITDWLARRYAGTSIVGQVNESGIVTHAIDSVCFDTY